MDTKVRLGIIGIGNMGSEHCRIILSGKTPEIELVAVADRRSERRAWAEAELKVPVFTEGEDLLASGLCDAVLIAVPHYQHPQLTLSALGHHLHVLCEKPIAVFTLAAREMIAAAQESDRTFALMFNQRTNCLYRKMKELLVSGEMGALKRVNWIITDWYRTQLYYDSGAWRATWNGEGGGVLLNQCPHQLDLLQWLCGMPVKIRAFCHEHQWHNIEVEDDVTAYLEYPNGATGVFVTTTGDLPGTNRLEITTEYGKMVCENDQLKLWKLAVSEREYCKTADDAFGAPSITITDVETDGGNPQHAGVLNAFASHILHGTPLTARGEEGLNELMLSNAMYLSAWQNKTVDLPFDEALFLKLLNQKCARSQPKNRRDRTFATDHSHGGKTVTKG